MDEAQLETLGQLVDKAENFLSLQKMPIPEKMRVESLIQAVTELRDEIKSFYLENGGEDVWEAQAV